MLLADIQHDGVELTPVLREVSWLRQLYWAIWKNTKLFMRRPLIFLVMIFSSVLSVVFAWLMGKDPEEDEVIYAPLSDCGTVDQLWIESLQKFTIMLKISSRTTTPLNGKKLI